MAKKKRRTRAKRGKPDQRRRKKPTPQKGSRRSPVAPAAAFPWQHVFQRLTDQEWQALGAVLGLSEGELSVLRPTCLGRSRKKMTSEFAVKAGAVQGLCARLHERLGVHTEVEVVMKVLPVAMQLINQR